MRSTGAARESTVCHALALGAACMHENHLWWPTRPRLWKDTKSNSHTATCSALRWPIRPKLQPWRHLPDWHQLVSRSDRVTLMALVLCKV
jgi:hypothetical protein